MRFAKRIWYRIARTMKSKHHLQRKAWSDSRLISLGSKYGGWTFADLSSLQGSVIISAGLGEDASFDVEFASKYGAKVVMVDPTPRAVAHYESLGKRMGMSAAESYSDDGRLAPESYDLSDVGTEQLLLRPCALWISEGSVEFFEPSNNDDVSHSVGGPQLFEWSSKKSIRVPTITMKQLVNEFFPNGGQPELVKLDIEGAEIEVIENMLEEKIFPRQLCVEYDEFNSGNSHSVGRIEACHEKLISSGYRLAFSNGQSDFCYFRAED